MKTLHLNNTIKKQFNRLTFENKAINEKILYFGLLRLLRFYEEANDKQKSDGLNWYKNEHKNVVKLKNNFNTYVKKYKQNKFRLTTENVCEIVSILSPLLRWDLNIQYAEKVLTFYKTECLGKVFKPFLNLELKMLEGNYLKALSTLESLEHNEIKTFAYKPKQFVNDVWNGQYLDIKHTKPFINEQTAFKTYNFKNNLLFANVENDFVTIDSHMTNAFFNTDGQTTTNEKGKVLQYENTDGHIIKYTWLNPSSKYQYNDIKKVIQLGAKLTNNKSDQFQAIVWNVVSNRLIHTDKLKTNVNPINNKQILKVAI